MSEHKTQPDEKTTPKESSRSSDHRVFPRPSVGSLPDMRLTDEELDLLKETAKLFSRTRPKK